MFEELKNAWRNAVANFWQELEAGSPDVRSRGVYREVAAARGQLDRLDTEIATTERRLGEERVQAEVCERRERLAKGIGDEETARIAAEYRARHVERARVLSAKLEALSAERTLWARDLVEMERALATDPAASSGRALEDLDRHPSEDEFRRVEEADRERTAEARLEELKRRMER